MQYFFLGGGVGVNKVHYGHYVKMVGVIWRSKQFQTKRQEGLKFNIDAYCPQLFW